MTRISNQVDQEMPNAARGQRLCQIKNLVDGKFREFRAFIQDDFILPSNVATFGQFVDFVQTFHVITRATEHLANCPAVPYQCQFCDMQSDKTAEDLAQTQKGTRNSFHKYAKCRHVVAGEFH